MSTIVYEHGLASSEGSTSYMPSATNLIRWREESMAGIAMMHDVNGNDKGSAKRMWTKVGELPI